jgi:hypothetical protein
MGSSKQNSEGEGKMKNVSIQRLAKVDVKGDEYFDSIGVVALQMVNVEFNFYGAVRVERLDSQIYADGTQRIIDGNGFIKDGADITNLIG